MMSATSKGGRVTAAATCAIDAPYQVSRPASHPTDWPPHGDAGATDADHGVFQLDVPEQQLDRAQVGGGAEASRSFVTCAGSSSITSELPKCKGMPITADDLIVQLDEAGLD
jgi:hypothetical protein